MGQLWAPPHSPLACSYRKPTYHVGHLCRQRGQLLGKAARIGRAVKKKRPASLQGSHAAEVLKRLPCLYPRHRPVLWGN